MIKNSKGVVFAYVKSIGYQLIHFVEANTTYKGLVISQKRNLFPLVIQGDSKNIIDMMKGDQQAPSW